MVETSIERYPVKTSGCGVQSKPVGTVIIDHENETIRFVDDSENVIDSTEYTRFKNLAVTRASDMVSGCGFIMTIA